NQQLLICPATDHIQGRLLSLAERFAMASKIDSRRRKQDEHGGLPDIVMLSVGMMIMVTFNIETDLDILNEEESQFSMSDPVVRLSHTPAYVLVRMLNTKVTQLEGLDKGVIPIVPEKRTFTILDGQKKKTVHRQQLPLTPSLPSYRCAHTFQHLCCIVAVSWKRGHSFAS
ncbi:hypothetical protein HD554DRAFT_2115658, partial [Boletus coccyginus]